ncbi:MAG: riboflavin synthase [Spirochaetota bacterium]
MFTGLIEEIGIVKSVKSSGESGGGIYLTVSAAKVLNNIKTGDSISIDGACQTVTGFTDDSFTVFASKVTMEATTFGSLSSGRRVNLERAMSADARFGGHFVQGHIDGRGKIKSIAKDGSGLSIEIAVSKGISKYIVAKGSIAVDGISLTVVALSDSGFRLYIIPETIKNTTLIEKKTGAEVNIEIDILSKYVEKMAGTAADDHEQQNKKLRRILMEEGFM